jgi:hypothetical protein
MPRSVPYIAAVLVLSVCVLAVPASAVAAKRGSVGGPPTRSPALAAKLRHAHPVSSPIVIGAGRGAGGRIELVAFHAKHGLCLFISRPRLGIKGGDSPGGCGVGVQPFPGGQITSNGASSEWIRGRGWLYFDEEWALSPSVARVTVTGRPAGRNATVPARIIYARPTPTMLRHLRETTPFALALSTWPDCILEETVQATAFDATGTVLQSATVALPGGGC